MTVNLTRIYTRRGDDGETDLGDRSRVHKTHPRVEAYGTVDELNSAIGLALAAGAMPAEFAGWLARIQNELLDVGADLSVPPDGADTRLRITAAYVERLERECDEVNDRMEPLRSFVIPGGTLASAHLHVCRTVCRRAERRSLAVADANPEVVRYLNRLSDLLFILARAANVGDTRERDTGEEGAAEQRDRAQAEPLWEPGGHEGR